MALPISGEDEHAQRAVDADARKVAGADGRGGKGAGAWPRGEDRGGRRPGEELWQEKLRERSGIGAALDDYETSLERRGIVKAKQEMSALRADSGLCWERSLTRSGCAMWSG